MKRGLLERLDSDGVVCAEGYLFEMERRGYLTSGEFVPEVALENPDALKILHQDFQHAGSDVIEAFTYNAHREKMRDFAVEAWRNNIKYLGVCCGAAPIHIREVAEAMGRKPRASRYSENMKKHFLYGDDEQLATHITDYGDRA
jgi:methionine synthase I (cobalamin-dependent)